MEEEIQNNEVYIDCEDIGTPMTKRAIRKMEKKKLKLLKKEKKKIKKQEKAKKKEQKRLDKLQGNDYKKRRFRLGDRPDGRKLRTLTPYARISPYIMKIRSDSQNHFYESIDITDIEEYIREKKKQGYKNFGLLHVLLAAYVRTVAKRPAVNRFIAGNKIYARNNIEVVMIVKKSMTTSSPDTLMKCVFKPTDTIDDVYEKWNGKLEEIMAQPDDTGFEKTASLINLIPGFLMKGAINFLRFLDYFGLLPKALTKVSPFHGSLIVTSMGSLGIGPIYHHLYDFGNLPAFISYGKMYSKIVVKENGETAKRHFVGLRAVTDERICDGFYYATAFKGLMHSINHPETLEVPPDEVVEDID